LKEFCQRECGFTERRLYQIISFAKAKAALPAKSEPLVQSERAARALSNVPETQRAEVLDEALRFHSKDGKITAESIVNAAKTEKLEEEHVDDNGKPVP
jgi:hypothetical protein